MGASIFGMGKAPSSGSRKVREVDSKMDNFDSRDIQPPQWYDDPEFKIKFGFER